MPAEAQGQLDSAHGLVETEAQVRASLGQPGKVAKPPPLTFKKRFQTRVAALLGSTLIRALGFTLRMRVYYEGQMHRPRDVMPRLDAFRGPEHGPLLFAVCHGSCYPVLHHWRNRGVCVVTSRSTDGQALAGVLHRLGYKTVHGSSSRGGTRALIDLARFVQKGGDAAIAVDGPRGPAQKVKPGIILLAKITGRPIVPLAATAKRYWRFKSWDRMRVPLPFTRTVITGDNPIYVPPDADHEVMEQKRVELEQKVLELQRKVDEVVQPKVWGYRGT